MASRSAAARAEYEARKKRVHEAFADKEACAYHVADARGKRIICAPTLAPAATLWSPPGLTPALCRRLGVVGGRSGH